MALEKLNSLLAEIDAIGDPDLKADLLIETADRFREVPPTIAKRPFTKENLVPGCESEAYMWAKRLDDGGIKFYFAVENPQGISAKCFAVILDEGLSGLAKNEILQVDEQIVFRIFGSGLSMGKGLGLKNMTMMAKRLAIKE